MGAFEYVAMDKSGKQSKGLLEGDTPKHVRQLLRDRVSLARRSKIIYFFKKLGLFSIEIDSSYQV